MKLILLSGGSGKRLWPLSNDSRSKQFLKVLKNEKGERVSMVQRVWEQLQMADLGKDSIVATSKAQIDVIQSQLGEDVPFIIEPERRDTFPAIALASAYLYSVRKVSLNEVVVVCPVDPFVEIHFFEHIKELKKVVEESHADLSLIGVKPTYHSAKYGYIIPESIHSNQRFYKVKRFKEKPTEQEAAQLITEDALWNCGVFAFKLGYLINLLEKKGLPIHFEQLQQEYKLLPKISFDYEVVEKANNIVVFPYGGYWKDLGTWNTLTEEMSTNLIGKGTLSKDSTNTHLINELDIPVAVLGVPNAVVAVSADGILVTDKAASPRIKELITDLDQRPMYEERRWGWYRVLDFNKNEDGTEILTKRICVKMGKNLSYQMHHKRNEVWTIIKGEGEFVLDGGIQPVKPGDVLIIPIGAKHAIKAHSDLEFIEVQQGVELNEDDIIRLLMTWDEVEEHCERKGDSS
ncbi:cupin domain-containing protein [Bacillus sp. FJAT-49705]|uniref:Cupin domain-containing protein n=1 Tax=Cytobacillus citreus TaxID=2833586 RepID=A0ABS5NXY7_9BACI|nr:sugar phosphate nucleotidyltransferase [Cytobacillus citreus]MBS4192692.1 cupin domain-containing protein [Cytobacillus citreus]